MKLMDAFVDITFLIYYYVKVGISVLNQRKTLSTHVSKENIMDIP
jgi:hypothetical protein